MLSAQSFIEKWRPITLKERSSYQQHFLDLCQLLGHPAPAEMDPTGEFFTFEAKATKSGGADGFADVWYRGHFAWEYKGKHANLEKAYQQLLQYREALENPPLLVVCDTEIIQIHTNFTNSVKRVYTLKLDDLATLDGLTTLRNVFYNPDKLQAQETTESVTAKAAAHFARLAEILRKVGHQSPEIAHFLIRLLFCMFAEDSDLLPNKIFSRLVSSFRHHPKTFVAQLNQLFSAMSTGGGFGPEFIPHFDGHLFDNAMALELDSDGLYILFEVSHLDWSQIEPSIFGTLFERSLDPSKRSQLGAHYTSKEDILLVIEPVLMAPYRQKWAEIQTKAATLLEKRAQLKGQKRNAFTNELIALIRGFADELASVRVLDPACGSGNFLYLALRSLLDLQKEIIAFAGQNEIGSFFPTVGPAQLYGIELNEYAYQLAQSTVQIGYIQWLRENGFGVPAEPILQPLNNIEHKDAILAYDANGKPIEPDWPAADVIIGNPPFLGGKRMRTELGDGYVDSLFAVYQDILPKEADLVCYWFEKSRAMIGQGRVRRAGLLATQAIRGGANRVVLQRIKESGDIFLAYSDRDWILDGANVHVSIVGFDNGSETDRLLNGNHVSVINANLSSIVDITQAKRLSENIGIAFMGDTKVGPFDIDNDTAQEMLSAGGNPNGQPNENVIRPWVNGKDITGRPRNYWIIDFGVDMTEEQAAQYEAPFEYIKKHVKQQRDQADKDWYHSEWWIHYAPRPAMRSAIKPLNKYIVTPRVAKYRLFVWLGHPVLPDCQLIVFARDDDYFLGVLHSRPHELWALRLGTALEDRPRYTPTTTFETFPMPWPPGLEPTEAPCFQSIALAARELVEKRDAWLNPPGLSETELKKRTLTNLYNQRPTWLDLAHKKLDNAVFAAYGWPDNLSDEEVLEELLKINLSRSRK